MFSRCSLPSNTSLRKHAYSNTFRILPLKKWKFSDKKNLIFFMFCSKHRLFVPVRTASARRFKRVPTIFVLSKIKKINAYPCKSQFYYIKVGFKGVNIVLVCFVMFNIFQALLSLWRLYCSPPETIPLLQVFFVHKSFCFVTVLLYLVFPHLFFFRCPSKARLYDCGLSLVT